MAKRKRRQSRNKNLIKQTIQFELVALLLIAIAIISLANHGKGWTYGCIVLPFLSR